jgi:hypothetical protein
VATQKTISQLPPIGPADSFAFAVFGDNQVYEYDPGPRFREVLVELDSVAPEFAVTVGDAVYSETNDDAVMRRKWGAFREALSAIRTPVIQTLGNHDAFDPPTMALWKELWGDTYFHWDAGCARFIALDCESEPARFGNPGSVPARLDGEQFAWLEGLLADSAGKKVFLFVHRPLFPVVGHVGDSLDERPGDRDRLHALLVRYRDRVAGVFHGHEHVFCHQDIDGIDYWHAAGSGSNLYAMPQQGGFYHFLLVKVSPTRVSVEVRRVGGPATPIESVRQVRPGDLLETWETGLTWVTWDYTTDIRPSVARLAKVGRGLSFLFDLSRNPSPYISAEASPALDLTGSDWLSVDIHVPAGTPPGLSVTPSLNSGEDKAVEGQPVVLEEGWNTVRLHLAGIEPGIISAVDSLSWSFSAGSRRGTGRVIFDWLRTESAGGNSVTGAVREIWATGLLWYAWNKEARISSVREQVEGRAGGTRLDFDIKDSRQPTLYALPYPYLYLSGISGLEVDVFIPAEAEDKLSVSLALENGTRSRSPWKPLSPGWNSLKFRLDGSWISMEASSDVRRLELSLSSRDTRLKSCAIFRTLRASW